MWCIALGYFGRWGRISHIAIFFHSLPHRPKQNNLEQYTSSSFLLSILFPLFLFLFLLSTPIVYPYWTPLLHTPTVYPYLQTRVFQNTPFVFVHFCTPAILMVTIFSHVISLNYFWQDPAIVALLRSRTPSSKASLITFLFTRPVHLSIF